MEDSEKLLRNFSKLISRIQESGISLSDTDRKNISNNLTKIYNKIDDSIKIDAKTLDELTDLKNSIESNLNNVIKELSTPTDIKPIKQPEQSKTKPLSTNVVSPSESSIIPKISKVFNGKISVKPLQSNSSGQAKINDKILRLSSRLAEITSKRIERVSGIKLSRNISDEAKSASSSIKDKLSGSSLFDDIGFSGDIYKKMNFDLSKFDGSILKSSSGLSRLFKSLNVFDDILPGIGKLAILGVIIDDLARYGDRTVNAYKEFLQVGETFTGSMSNMNFASAQAGESLENLVKLTNAYGNGLRLFGIGNFSILAKQVRQSTLEFQNMGLSTHDINRAQALYLSTIIKSGARQTNDLETDLKSGDLLSNFNDFMNSTNLLAATTGRSIKEVLDIIKDQASDLDFNALLSSSGYDEKQKDKFRQASAALALLGKSGSEIIKSQLKTGNIITGLPSDIAKQMNLSFGPSGIKKLQEVMNNLTDNSISASDAVGGINSALRQSGKYLSNAGSLVRTMTLFGMTLQGNVLSASQTLNKQSSAAAQTVLKFQRSFTELGSHFKKVGTLLVKLFDKPLSGLASLALIGIKGLTYLVEMLEDFAENLIYVSRGIYNFGIKTFNAIKGFSDLIGMSFILKTVFGGLAKIIGKIIHFVAGPNISKEKLGNDGYLETVTLNKHTGLIHRMIKMFSQAAVLFAITIAPFQAIQKGLFPGILKGVNAALVESGSISLKIGIFGKNVLSNLKNEYIKSISKSRLSPIHLLDVAISKISKTFGVLGHYEKYKSILSNAFLKMFTRMGKLILKIPSLIPKAFSLIGKTLVTQFKSLGKIPQIFRNFDETLSSVSKMIGSVGEVFLNIFGKVGKFISPLIKSVGVVGRFGKFITPVLKLFGIIGKFIPFLNVVILSVSGAVAAITSQFHLGNRLKNAGILGNVSLSDRFSALRGSLINVITLGLFGWLTKKLSHGKYDSVTVIVSFNRFISERMKIITSSIKSKIKSQTKKIFDNLVNFFPKLIDSITSLISNMISGAVSMIPGASEVIGLFSNKHKKTVKEGKEIKSSNIDKIRINKVTTGKSVNNTTTPKVIIAGVTKTVDEIQNPNVLVHGSIKELISIIADSKDTTSEFQGKMVRSSEQSAHANTDIARLTKNKQKSNHSSNYSELNSRFF